MVDYEKKHKSLNCPICNKPLIISESHNQVACSDINCKFNNNIDIVNYCIK
jgi:hypothetical protein